MESSILKKAAKFLKGRKKYSVAIMGVLAATAVGFETARPALTLEREVYCGLEEHTHMAECYAGYEDGEQEAIPETPVAPTAPVEEIRLTCTVTGPVAHTHGDGCYGTDGTLVCTLEEKEFHTHGAECYGQEKKLICGQEEREGHAHGEECYTVLKELICGQEEVEAHIHDSLCYGSTQELVCGTEEREGHSHGEECYDADGNIACGQEESEGHVHGEECYISVSTDELVCGKEETEGHAHGEECYEEKRELACGKEEAEGHTHTESCYEDESELICGKEELEEHVHGEGCFSVETIDGGSTGSEDNTGNVDSAGDIENTEVTEVTDGLGNPGDEELICGKEEHVHTEECYDLGIMLLAEGLLAKGDGWELDTDGLLTVQGTDALQNLEYSSASEAPWYEHRDEVISVKISGIQRIAQTFREYKNLADVEILGDTIYIGNYSFYNCSSLENIAIGPETTYIGDYAFKGCNKLQNLDIQANNLTIKGLSFERCSSLNSVVIRGTIKSIDNYAFSDCKGLNSVRIEGNVTGSVSGFNGCGALKEFEVTGSVGSIGYSAFKSCSSLTNITIPSGAKSIGSDAFMHCSSLVGIDIPDGVDSIGVSAFYGCRSLIDITIPDSVKSIGSDAFEGCSSLASIVFPDGVPYIAYDTFSGCSSLEEFSIPESVQFIGTSAFKNCSSLKEITFPENMNRMDSDAFYGCTGLTSIVLPTNVSTIPGRAFYNCTGLSEVTIPPNVEKLSNNVFAGCNSLKKVVLEAKNLQVETGVFPANVKKLVIKCDSVEAIKSGLPPYFTSTDVIFEGEGFFELEAPLALGSPARNKLNAGKYYADGTGALYLLKGEGAALAYVPAGKEEYIVLSDIPAEDGGESRKVTSVVNNALKMADGLKRLSFASVENIQTLPGYSCGNCPSLEAVNGWTTVDEVLAMFRKDAQISPLAFYNTGLGGEGQGSPSGDDIAETIILNGEERDLFRISTAKNGNGEREFYTGQNVKTTVYVSNPSNQNPYSVLRCYVAFDDATGRMSYSPGTYTFKTTKIMDEDGTVIEGAGCRVDVSESDAAYTYYFDIFKPQEGDALQFDFTTVYLSPTSAGGTAKIWAVPLSQEQWENLGNDVIGGGGVFHQITWGTKADTFQVNKVQGTKKTPFIRGNGKEEGIVTVQDLQYEISMNRKEDTELGVGKDHMLSADFTDTFTLPEGTKWKDGLLEAVRNGQYRWQNSVYSTSYTHTLYVTINGEEYILFKISGGSGSISVEAGNFSVEEESLNFEWKVTNKDAEKEINLPKISVEFGNDVIVLDDVMGNNTYVFHNRVDVKQHFTYSQEQESFSEVDVPVSASEAKVEISKIHENGLYTQRLGNDINFKITLKNSGGLPGGGLDNVTDSLPNRFYIKPEKIQSLISSMKNGEMQGVQELNIKISNATLCRMDGSGDYIPGESVTGTDGNEYVLNHNNAGIGTTYENKEWTDPAVADSAAEINISYSNEDGLEMSYKGKEGEKAVDGPDIGAALDGIGYMVTSRDVYTITWKFEENYMLHSGMAKEFELPASAKDSFMWAGADTEEHLVQSSTSGFWGDYNRAYMFDKDGKQKSSSCEIRTNYEFELQKAVSIDDGQESQGESVASGDILTYSLNVVHSGEEAYDILPLVDRMQGAQVLMVPVEGNGVLDSYGLDRENVEGIEYYLLSKPDTYKGVILGDALTDSIVVKKGADGLDTVIRWYLTDLNGGGNLNKTLRYKAKVDTSQEKLGATYSLSNKSWLNDHQTHRLYDEVFLVGSDLIVDKNIVISPGETPERDELEKYSIIGQGDKVTYRLMITNVGGTRTVNGKDLYDILPRTSGFVWSKDNVKIRYMGTVSEDSYTNGDSWEIVDGGTPGIQKIQWNENFQADINRTMYIYVTLSYPDGSQWQAYASDKACAAERLENTFYCYQMNDTVYHDLAVEAEAYLQKGVYESTSITAEDSRKYYANSISNNQTKVIYYVAVYNSGNTRLYLDEIQDRLPRGFRYNKNAHISEQTHYERRPSSLTMADGTVVRPNWVRNFSTRQRDINEDGSLIGFSLSGGRLKYDDLYKKYYLAPNEAVVITYECIVGDYGYTDTNAINSVAMPYVDTIGGGLEVTPGLTMKGAVHDDNKDMEGNDGNCYQMSAEDAAEKGFIIGDEAFRWLASDVKLERGDILPGITKKVESVTKGGDGNVQMAPDSASATDTINWEITATNSGHQGIYNYTLTDVMEAPYAITGEVSYERKDSQSEVLSSEKLFRVDGRAVENGRNCLILTPVEKYVSWETDFGGYFDTSKNQPLHFPEGNVLTIGNKYRVTFSVNERKEEELSVTVINRDHPILPGGSGILRLSTRNTGTDIYNKTYYNNCYITPEEQSYDGSIVNQGSQTEWKGKPSVYNRAQILVTYGDMTSSVKRVKEIENPENWAASDEEKNSILLPGADSIFRYMLEVNNSSANGKAMDELVLIDNLPEINDHSPFNDKESRFSKFKVRLADTPDFEVYVVTAEGKKVSLSCPAQYTLEYHTKTKFDTADWSGGGTGWSGQLDTAKARAFRIIIKDMGTAGGEPVIPPGAKVVVEFTGQIACTSEAENDAVAEELEPGTTAWNSFGYRCRMKGSNIYLEATPLNVGVRIPDVPRLTKYLVDEEGNEVASREEKIFQFLIYEGEALALKEGYTDEELALALLENNRAFTCIGLMVERGKSQSETMALNNLQEWKFEEGEWSAAESSWTWEEGHRYTVVELPLEEEGIYEFYSLGGSINNSYTFAHSIEQGKRIHAVNSQENQKLFELPESGGKGIWGYILLGILCIMGACFLRYGKAGIKRIHRQKGA